MATSTNHLEFIVSLIDKISAPTGAILRDFDRMQAHVQKGYHALGQGVAGVVGAGFAAMTMIDPARDMNKAIGEVASLGTATDVLDKLNIAALQFSADYGESASQFVRSSYDIASAIQGLTGDDLPTFTRASALLAKGTKGDVTQISDYMGTMYGIFQKDAKLIGNAAWVEKMAAQTAMAVNIYKSTGKGMADAFTAFGAAGTSAGRPMEEQMAAIGSLQATMPGEQAGTKLKYLFANFKAAEGKLGIKFTDAHDRMLPLTDLLESLQTKFGAVDKWSATTSESIGKAFGSHEATDAIKLLMLNIDQLKTDISSIGKQTNLAALEKMTQSMIDPFSRLSEGAKGVVIAVGQKLIPTLLPGIDRIVMMEKNLMRWADLFPHLTTRIGQGIAFVLGLIAVVGSLSIAVGIGRFLLVGWNVAMIGARLAIWPMAAALKVLRLAWVAMNAEIILGGSAWGAAAIRLGVFTRTLLGGVASLSLFGVSLGGIGTAIATAFAGVGGVLAGLTAPVWAAIAAVALGAALIYRYWEPVKAFFGGVWQGLVSGLAPVFDAIAAAFGPLLSLFSPLFEFVAGFFRSIGRVAGLVFDAVASWFGPLEFTTAQLGAAAAAGQVFGEILAAAIRFALNPFAAVGAAVDWLLGKFPVLSIWWQGFTGWLATLHPLDAIGAGVDWLMEKFAGLRAWWDGFAGWLASLNPFAGWGAKIDSLMGRAAGMSPTAALPGPVPSLVVPAGKLPSSTTSTLNQSRSTRIGDVHVHNYGAAMSGQRLAAELAMHAA